MSTLYTLQRPDQIRALSSAKFDRSHKEADLQRWADQTPYFLNDGLPMLSLGTEIPTHHGDAIDNLFLDGNADLVVCELKRGRPARDATAQLLDYAAFAAELSWSDIEVQCHGRHDEDLATAFENCFGRPLITADQPGHRLLLIAENYTQRHIDSARYLINKGLPLVLLRFTYFEIGSERLIEVQPILGEIPEQSTATRNAGARRHTAEEGYVAWLLGTVAEQLKELAREEGWSLRLSLNKQSLVFALDTWPTKIRDCQLRLDVWTRDSLQFAVEANTETLPEFENYLRSHDGAWKQSFPAQFQEKIPSSSWCKLSYRIPCPPMGNATALADVVSKTEAMARSIIPVVDEYLQPNPKGNGL